MTLDDLLMLVCVIGAAWAVRLWIGDRLRDLRAWVSNIFPPPAADRSVNPVPLSVPDNPPEPPPGTARNSIPVGFRTVPDPAASEPHSAPPEPAQWSEDGLIALLARQKTPDGKWRYTATQIAEFVGGRRQERLQQIAGYRGTAKPLPTINGATARLGEEVGRR